MKRSCQLLLWSLFSTSYLYAQLPSSVFTYQLPKLEVHRLRTEEKSGLRIHDLRFNGVANNEIPAYLVEPREGCGTKGQSCAGVLFVHWYEPKAANANRSEFLPEAYELARHGAVSLLVDTMWAEPDWFEKRNPEEDYNNSVAQIKNLRRALDVLTKHPGVDRTRIGYVGHDFGMMFGAILAGIDHRVRPVALMAGTSCLSDWYLLGRKLNQQQREQVKSKLSVLCPTLYLPRATGPALLQFGETDSYVPIKNAQAMASSAPQPKRVRFYEAGHELNGQARIERLEWLQLRLRLRPRRER